VVNCRKFAGRMKDIILVLELDDEESMFLGKLLKEYAAGLT